MLSKIVRKNHIFIQQVRHAKQKRQSFDKSKPRHLICFKEWTTPMIVEVLQSAINLKVTYKDTHHKKVDVLPDARIVILQEVNEPILNMAVSKAASFLGATHVTINDQMVWDHDYHGSIFSFMADAMFVSTTTHACVQRFANKSKVPVICMMSRTHASIQALATVMAILEEYGSMKSLNVAWVGAPHPVLNSYLLLCPMLGANVRFKCCCKECPVSPLLLQVSKNMVKRTGTIVKECPDKKECIKNGTIFISGPARCKEKKTDEYALTIKDIKEATSQQWVHFHTCPRGKEVDDDLFYHANARTFQAFENMQYIAAALMAYTIKGYTFPRVAGAVVTSILSLKYVK